MWGASPTPTCPRWCTPPTRAPRLRIAQAADQPGPVADGRAVPAAARRDVRGRRRGARAPPRPRGRLLRGRRRLAAATGSAASTRPTRRWRWWPTCPVVRRWSSSGPSARSRASRPTAAWRHRRPHRAPTGCCGPATGRTRTAPGRTRFCCCATVTTSPTRRSAPASSTAPREFFGIDLDAGVDVSSATDGRSTPTSTRSPACCPRPRRRSVRGLSTTWWCAARSCSTAAAARGSRPTSPSTATGSRWWARTPGTGREELDGRGLVLAPGFIDPHTHLDANLSGIPTSRRRRRYGVTTVVTATAGTRSRRSPTTPRVTTSSTRCAPSSRSPGPRSTTA